MVAEPSEEEEMGVGVGVGRGGRLADIKVGALDMVKYLTM